MLESFTYPVAGAMLLVASITDLRTREVPDWLNYSGAIVGLGSSLIYSLAYWNFWPFIFSVAGCLVFFALAWVMFYAGQWGGGDSKMLVALGALFGLQFGLKFPFISLQQVLISFWINLLIVGVIYAMFWSAVLAFKHWKKFRPQFIIQFKELAKYRLSLGTLLAVVVALYLLVDEPVMKAATMGAAVATFVGVFLLVFAKAVEKSCMLKYISPLMLTEGDWIANDVYVGKSYVTGPKDLGIEKSQIKRIIGFYRKGKIRRVLVKEGIPFVPSFLLAFLASVFFGNLLLRLFMF